MTDEQEMPRDDHLDNPLDYLYEELPPEEMEAARLHLAECPECREEMKRIRDAVKIYRMLPKPVAPAGLAGRTAAMALEAAARAEPTPVAAREPEPERPSGIAKPEPARPASERVAPDRPVAEMRAAERADIAEAATVDIAEVREEVLGEIRRGWRAWFFHPAWTIAASVIFICALLIHVSPRNSYREAAPIRDAVMEAPAPRQARQQPAPRELQRLPAAEPLRMDDAPAAAAPSRLSEAEAWEEDAASAPVPAAPPPPPTAPAMRPAPFPAPAFGAPSVDRGFADSFDKRFGASSPSAALPAAPMVLGESAGEAGAAARDTVIVDLYGLSEPPELLPRPPAVDTDKLARDLITLAGMQIGAGELAEAKITIGLLRKYDPERADALDEVVREMERRAADESAAEEPAEEPAVDEAQSAVPAPGGDKYLSDAPPPVGSGITAAGSIIFAAPPEPAPAEPVAAFPVEVEPSEPLPPVSAPDVFDAPSDGWVYLGPVYGDPLPPFAETPPAAAPDVPKSSPDALPPTLMDAGGGTPPFGRSRRDGQQRSGLFRRPAFSTDPYVRDN